MPKTLRKSGLHSNKQKPKIKQKPNKTKSDLSSDYKHLNRNYYQETALLNINSFILYINELRRFPIFR